MSPTRRHIMPLLAACMALPALPAPAGPSLSAEPRSLSLAALAKIPRIVAVATDHTSLMRALEAEYGPMEGWEFRSGDADQQVIRILAVYSIEPDNAPFAGAYFTVEHEKAGKKSVGNIMIKSLWYDDARQVAHIGFDYWSRATMVTTISHGGLASKKTHVTIHRRFDDLPTKGFR